MVKRTVPQQVELCPFSSIILEYKRRKASRACGVTELQRNRLEAMASRTPLLLALCLAVLAFADAFLPGENIIL
eukprot:364592-Rhodomonas_salina.2